MAEVAREPHELPGKPGTRLKRLNALRGGIRAAVIHKNRFKCVVHKRNDGRTEPLPKVGNILSFVKNRDDEGDEHGVTRRC